MSRSERRDDGLTLVELLVVVSLIGLVMFVIAAAFTTIVRVAPNTMYRIDDARSTRGLHTWLTRDISSTPPHVYDTATGTGYVDGSYPSPGAAGVPGADVCAPPGGTHVLFMAWSDRGVSYRAQYTIEGDAGSGFRVVRTICGGDDDRLPLTGDVSNGTCASSFRSALTITDADSDGVAEATVNLCLVSTQPGDGLLGGDGQQEITLSVASRNGDT